MRLLHLLIFALLISLATAPVSGQEADEKAQPEKTQPEKAPSEAAPKATEAPKPVQQPDGKAAAARFKAEAEARAKAKANARADVKNAGDDCPGGVSFDDGGPEIGYGFVRTAKWGVFLQRFETSLFPGKELEKVCLCLRRGGTIDEADYELVFYEEQGGRPAEEPYASIAARAEAIPFMRDEKPGRFYPVEAKLESGAGVELRGKATYIGVRFDPSVAQRFAVCADKSEGSKPVLGYQRDDRAGGWDNMLQTKDWLFDGHKTLMIRAIGKAPAEKAKESSGGE